MATNSSSEKDTGGSSNVQQLARVSVKIPPFWKEYPDLWFHQIESQFESANVTVDRTKYHILVAAMDNDILFQVSDIVRTPPETGMYNAIKVRLLKQYADTDHSKLKKLLLEMELGDKKPSALLRAMKDLAGNRFADDVLKTLWMQRLPRQTQAILAVSDDIALDTLADQADKIGEVTVNSHISANSSQSVNEITDLRLQISELIKQMKELRSRSSERSQRSSSRPRNRSKSKPRHSDKKYCFFHNRYGNEAKNCKSPCAFSTTGNEQARR